MERYTEERVVESITALMNGIDTETIKNICNDNVKYMIKSIRGSVI